MPLKFGGRLAAASLFLLIAACGGGGGVSPAADAGAGAAAFSLSSHAVAATANTLEGAPTQLVTINVQNAPAFLYASVASSYRAVERVDAFSITPANDVGTLQIQMKDPALLGPGTYADQVSLYLCYDAACASQLAGSPALVLVSYIVTGTALPDTQVSVSPMSLTVPARTTDAAPVRAVSVTLTHPPAGALYTMLTPTQNGIQSASYQVLSSTAGSINIQFRNPGTLGAGTYSDSLYFVACFDPNCTHRAGSPQQLDFTYVVSGPLLPDHPLLPIAATASLPHNVVDAKFSPALESVVMASSYPGNALYLYDTVTGAEKSVALEQVPTALSVSPDGLSAAVGHDALISLVDLGALAAGNAPVAQAVAIGTKVQDLALGGNGYVYATPADDQSGRVHAVELATQTETLGNRTIFTAAHLALLPGASRLYVGLNPEGLMAFDIASGPSSFLREAQHDSLHSSCANLWMSASGNFLYTACGYIFRASADAAQDMVYAGALQLTRTPIYGYNVQALSESGPAGEIGLIEYDLPCRQSPHESSCRAYVDFYDSGTLQRTASYSMPIKTLAGTTYDDEPLYIFHNSAGSARFVISRVVESAATGFYLHRVD